MQVRKVIIYSLVISVALTQLLLALFAPKAELIGVIICILSACGLWVIGLLIGVILSAIVKRPATEPWLYFSGQIATYTALIVFIGIQLYIDKKHKEKFGNIEHNHSFIGYSSTSPEYSKIAFNKLESTFTDRNSFYLTSYFIRKRDTVLSTYSETIHSVYFSYVTNKQDSLYSKVSVLEDKAFIEVLNGNATTDETFLIQQLNEGLERQKVIDAMHEVIKALPDSLGKKIKKSLKE